MKVVETLKGDVTHTYAVMHKCCFVLAEQELALNKL